MLALGFVPGVGVCNAKPGERCNCAERRSKRREERHEERRVERRGERREERHAERRAERRTINRFSTRNVSAAALEWR